LVSEHGGILTFPSRRKTASTNPGDDQLRQGALADLPGTVDHHDAGIPQRFNSEPLGMPRKQISSTDHGLRLRS
jgi:hypothetical protein